jgi:hypothetical protein
MAIVKKDVIFLTIAVIGICFIGGCVNQSQSIVPSKDPSLFICKEGQDCSKQNVSIISKANLTDAEKKLSTDLLQLIGVIDFPTGMNRDALERQMKQAHQLMWIDTTGKKTENKTDYPVVYVYIKTREKIDAGFLDPYVWNVTNADPANQLIVAWVNVPDLTTLASLDSVLSIQTVIPPLTLRDSGNKKETAK